MDIEKNITIPLMLNGAYIQQNNSSSISGFDYYGTNGEYSNARAKFTWYRINFETLLGDNYKEYDYFNISLAHFQTIFRVGVGNVCFYDAANVLEFNKYRCLNIYIEGLDFINSTYNNATGSYRKKGILSQFSPNAISTTSIKEQFNDSWVGEGLIFRKTKTANITIGIGSSCYDEYVRNSQYKSDNSKMANWCIKLNINPVKKI